FSSDAQLLAIGGTATAVIWDTTAHRVVQTLTGHVNRVSSIRFSPDQKTIATASWDYTLRLWDAATGKNLGVLRGHKGAVINCVFSPDGRTLVSVSDDRTIRFWNVATLREVASIQLNGTGMTLDFSPDGKMLIADDSDGLRCWRAPLLAEIDSAEHSN